MPIAPHAPSGDNHKMSRPHQVSPLGENSCLSHSWWSHETQALSFSSADGLELSLSPSRPSWANLRVMFSLLRYSMCSSAPLFLAMPGLCCHSGFPLVAASRGCSLAVVCRLLTAAASLLVELGLRGAADSVAVVPGLSSCGSQPPSTVSVAVAHRCSCSKAREILPDQGLNPCFLLREADSLPLSQQGSLRVTC